MVDDREKSRREKAGSIDMVPQVLCSLTGRLNQDERPDDLQFQYSIKQTIADKYMTEF